MVVGVVKGSSCIYFCAFEGGGGVQDLGRCIASGSFLESQSVLACFHQNRAEPAPCLAHRRFSEAISFFESVFQRSNHR